MIAVVSGSRSLRLFPTQIKRLIDFYHITKFHFGDARGIDQSFLDYCVNNDFLYGRYRANWKRYGKSAGVIRNKEMIYNPEISVGFAFWDGSSRGTLNAIKLMKKRGIYKIVDESLGLNFNFKSNASNALIINEFMKKIKDWF